MLNLLELSDGWGHLEFGGNWDGNRTRIRSNGRYTKGVAPFTLFLYEKNKEVI